MATVTASTSITVTAGSGRNSRTAATTVTATHAAKVGKIYVTARTRITVTHKPIGDSGYMAGKRYRR